MFHITKKYFPVLGIFVLLAVSGCAGTQGKKTLTYKFGTSQVGTESGADIFSVPNVSFSGTAVFDGDEKKQKLQFMAVRQNENIKLKLFTGLAGSVMELIVKDGTYMAAFSGAPEIYQGTALNDRIRIPETGESISVNTLLYAFCPKKDMAEATETKVGADRILTTKTPGGIIRKLKKHKNGLVTQQAFSGTTTALSVLYTNWNTAQSCPYPKHILILDAAGKSLAELKIKKCRQKDSVNSKIFDTQSFEENTRSMRNS